MARLLSESVMGLRRYYRNLIAAHGVVPDRLWNQRVTAYNVQFLLRGTVAARLASVQQDLLQVDPVALLACPSRTFHISIAWILAARTDYGRAKDEMWTEISEACNSALRAVARKTAPFVVHFGDLVVTDTAVICVGTDGGSMSRLRQQISSIVPIPAATQNSSSFVHVTLLRYGGHLLDPPLLIEAAAACRCDVSVKLDRITVVRETVYPSLEAEEKFSALFGVDDATTA